MHSIWISESTGWSDAFADDAVGKECREVRGKIADLFRSYEQRDKTRAAVEEFKAKLVGLLPEDMTVNPGSSWPGPVSYIGENDLGAQAILLRCRGRDHLGSLGKSRPLSIR